MAIISGSVSFRGRFGDHFRAGDHFGVGIISEAVQFPIFGGREATTGNASAVRRLPETGMIGGFLTRISVRTFRPHPVWDPRATTDRSRALFTRFICCRLANQSFVRLLRSLYFARKSSKHTEMGRESASYIRYVLKYAFYGTLVLIKRLLCWKLIESA